MLKSKLGDGLNQGKNLINNFIQSTSYVTLFILFIVLMIIIGISIYISKKLRYESTKCKDLETRGDGFSISQKLIPIPSNDLNRPLNDFRIVSAYNCCSIGKNRASFVKECALKNCLQLGARFLDFEIYDINSKPFISTSTSLNFNYKESYNKYDLESAMRFIERNAFDNEFVTNHSDPIILHFRIKSNNVMLFNNIAKILNNVFSDRLLSRDNTNLTRYANNFSGTAFTEDEIVTFGNDDITDNKYKGDANTRMGNIPKPLSMIPIREFKDKVVLIVKNYYKGENCNGMEKNECYLPDNKTEIIGWNQYGNKGLGFNIDPSFAVPNSPSNTTNYYDSNETPLKELINNISTTTEIENMENEYIKIFTESQARSTIKDSSKTGYNIIGSFNKYFMSIVIPEIISDSNYDPNEFFDNDFQIIAMNFQYIDENLKSYLNYFKNSNGNIVSFKLKDCAGSKLTNPKCFGDALIIDNAGPPLNSATCLTYTDGAYSEISSKWTAWNAAQDNGEKASIQSQINIMIQTHNSTCNADDQIAVKDTWKPTGGTEKSNYPYGYYTRKV